MPVPFVARQRINPQQLQAPRKYYPIVVSSGVSRLPQIAQRISGRCTLSRGDVVAAIDALLQILQEDLTEGRIVELGDFGSFMLSVQGNGEFQSKRITAKHITGRKIVFRPGAELKTTLRKLSFQKKRSR